MQDIDAVAAAVGRLLLQQKLMLATAESCTGGMVASAVTSVAGSSGWFDRGWVTYSNAAKMSELGVDSYLLEDNGAVSHDCVIAMARGAIRQSSAQVSIAVSGIAGPGGAAPGKPLGTVWIAWAQKLGYAEAELFEFEGDRQMIRKLAAKAALDGLYKRLKHSIT